MSSATRIVVSPPPGAVRARATHARPAVPTRAPLGAFASTLLGTVAGLVTGAVFVAGAPAVGRTPTADAAPAAMRGAAAGQARGEAAASVSAILTPAIDAGVVPAPDPEGARP
ncbi:hypothetical protein [Scleromatobacter humisilvae]|uniref:Uncharacterized protein n=1 Tax=Scleromatobacter humisilvae TaxID=2897159 RepID=A0A9X1YMR2_9BURK|nr:hypothetical protein [Scleromatobacter humisilvae]MCK9684366.1 hypothetical protein [Scleromatobacter humisilvae]